MTQPAATLSTQITADLYRSLSFRLKDLAKHCTTAAGLIDEDDKEGVSRFDWDAVIDDFHRTMMAIGFIAGRDTVHRGR